MCRIVLVLLCLARFPAGSSGYSLIDLRHLPRTTCSFACLTSDNAPDNRGVVIIAKVLSEEAEGAKPCLGGKSHSCSG